MYSSTARQIKSGSFLYSFSDASIKRCFCAGVQVKLNCTFLSFSATEPLPSVPPFVPFFGFGV